MDKEKQQLMAFNRQLSRVYSIAIIQASISAIGLAAVRAEVDFSLVLFCTIFCLACVVLVYMQPWKISTHLGELLEYKRGFEAITEHNRNKNDKRYKEA